MHGGQHPFLEFRGLAQQQTNQIDSHRRLRWLKLPHCEQTQPRIRILSVILTQFAELFVNRMDLGGGIFAEVGVVEVVSRQLET